MFSAIFFLFGFFVFEIGSGADPPHPPRRGGGVAVGVSFAVVNLVRTLTGKFPGSGYYVRKASLAVQTPMRDLYYDCLPVSVALAVILATPIGTAFAQDSNRLAATFNERFPVEETSPPPPLDIPEVKEERSVTKRAANVVRPRVAAAPRSFLNAGTKMLPSNRKFWVKEPTATK
jgi:hypothetical protein